MKEKVTLAVDIGGTNLKLGRVSEDGGLLEPLSRAPCPAQKTPNELAQVIATMARGLGEFDRASVGFPGVVKRGITYNAPNLDDAAFTECAFAAQLSGDLGCPVRMANDADLQGLGVVRGTGVELALTLGTGLGSGLFLDGVLVPNLELGHHPYWHGGTYEDRVSDRAYKSVGPKEFTRRVHEVLETVQALLSPTQIFVGGGNMNNLVGPLPGGAIAFRLEDAFKGAIRLWDTAR